MCSIGEDDFGDDGGLHTMVPDVNVLKENHNRQDVHCKKCGSPKAEYKLAFREAECKECFLHYARHKFRATLGSSKILPKNSNVIVIFDGSAQSTVLLDMLHYAQTQNTFKRLHCNTEVLIIDNYRLCSNNSCENELSNFIANIKDCLREFEFECFITPLAREWNPNLVFNLKTLPTDYCQLVKESTTSFINSLNTIKSLTSRQDFIKHHRSKVISEAAKHMQCNFAFLADISSDLACDLLAAISLGRGASAAMDVALVDDRLSNSVQIVRPLKDLNENEIQLYVKAQDLRLLEIKSYGDDVGSSGSLQNLTKSFVKGLQINYSSTVSTVSRTGSKITRKVNGEDTAYCSFCKSLLDCKNSPTLLAIDFSRVVSQIGNKTENALNPHDKINHNVNEGTPFSTLCHACRNIYAETTNKNLLQ
ncbi:cytosolic thiouridylase subunit 2 [Haematobia irritans]|uniref:cytosolic thiouridylase subunit 2 n=1 Tax=Haematobia irritans TaxID=7368 RepID=UPI003F50CCAD